MIKLYGYRTWKGRGYWALLSLTLTWMIWKCAPNVGWVALQDQRSSASSPGDIRKSSSYFANKSQKILPNNEYKAPLHTHEPVLRPRRLPAQPILTAILPVSTDSVEHLQETLTPLFAPKTVLKEILLITSGDLRPKVSANLLRILQEHAGEEHPEVSIKVHDVSSTSAVSPSVLRLLNRSDDGWVLIMDDTGLRGLDRTTRSMILDSIVDWRLPYGPDGELLATSSDLSFSLGEGWTHHSPSKPLFSSRLNPPFVLPLDVVAASGGIPHSWEALSKQIAQYNSWNASGIIMGQRFPRQPSPMFAVAVEDTLGQAPLNVTSRLDPPTIVASSRAVRVLKFDIVVSSRRDVQNLSSFLCTITPRGHLVRIVVVDETLKFSLNPIKRKTRLVTNYDGCLLDFFTVNQYMRWKEVLSIFEDDAAYNGLSDVAITLKGHNFGGFLMSDFGHFNDVIIEVPRENLPFCDWMALLTLQQWKNWHTPKVEFSVITRDRPESLSRLLRSLEAAPFFGDKVDLRMNIEEDCDPETLKIARNFSWSPGSLFLHHRVIHGGLLPAVVESWYPQNNHTYGLLLEDDVELSPLFYAWIKMTLLRYRYDDEVDKSPDLFGISLYQQKNVELRPEGRIPFNARAVFSNAGLPFPATPYLSQVPCSWGAIYFPEHWSKFHNYLLLRFSGSWIPKDEIVVLPSGIRSNHWRRSWKKFFIELAYLKGWVMLYPNYDEFLSLSTNHLEYGVHVRTRSKAKRDLFDQPLFPMPELDENGMSRPTRLLELPDGSLPRYRDLPILNLTAGITTEEELRRAGQERQAALDVHGTLDNAIGLSM